MRASNEMTYTHTCDQSITVKIISYLSIMNHLYRMFHNTVQFSFFCALLIHAVIWKVCLMLCGLPFAFLRDLFLRFIFFFFLVRFLILFWYRYRRNLILCIQKKNDTKWQNNYYWEARTTKFPNNMEWLANINKRNQCQLNWWWNDLQLI